MLGFAVVFTACCIACAAGYALRPLVAPHGRFLPFLMSSFEVGMLGYALYGLLAFCTLVPYFLLYDYSGIWNASVSSQFNYFSDMLVVRPFLAWGDFTVGQYLAAALALGAVLTAVFSLLASVCGTLVRSPYLAALALCLVCFGGLGLVSVLGELGWWAAYLIACFQPVTVWLSCSAWFTELGLNAVLPWQETIASGLNLLLLGGGVLLALGWFDRKDVS